MRKRRMNSAYVADPIAALRAAWLRPKQTDLVPGKGQFRSRFRQSAQLRRHRMSRACPLG